MKIKIENNTITVAQESTQDLTLYRDATYFEEQIINTANETKTMAQINGAYYNPQENEKYQAERAEIERISKNMGLQNQINALELKRVRALAEPGIKDEETGETYLEAITKDIQELRIQMT